MLPPELYTMVSNIAKLDRRIAPELSLDTKRPGLDIARLEVREKCVERLGERPARTGNSARSEVRRVLPGRHFAEDYQPGYCLPR